MEVNYVVCLAVAVVAVLVVALLVSKSRKAAAVAALDSHEIIVKIGKEFSRGSVVVMSEDLVQVRVYVDPVDFMGVDLTAEQVIKKLTEGERNGTIAKLDLPDEVIIKQIGVSKERLREIREIQV